MWTSALWNHPYIPLQWGAVLGASLAAAVIDLRSHRIPNLLTGPVLLAGLVVSGLVAGPAGLADSAGGAVMLGLPFVVLFLIGGGGAGDAKMMAALGTWLGVNNALIMLPAVTITGGILGLTYAAGRRQLRPVLINLQLLVWMGLPRLARLKVGRRAGDGGVETDTAILPAPGQMLAAPYGLSIFVGTCIAAAGVWLWRA